MRNSTLIFLIKRSASNEIASVCLAMKKRGFGAGRWNGVGGKVTEGESVEATAIREAGEEIGVKIVASDLSKAAELEFHFPAKPEWDQMVHAYLVEKWEGVPAESEEMRPQWFALADIPFADMWPDDIIWLPKVLAGEKVRERKVKGSFSFGEKDVILEQSIEVVQSFGE